MTEHNEEIVEEVIIETEEKPRIEKVVTGTVIKKKKGLIERAVLALMGPDGLPKVGKTISKDIIVPTLKNLLTDSLKSGIDMMAYGKNNQGPNNTPPGNGYYYNGSGNNYNQNVPYNQSYQSTTPPVTSIVPQMNGNQVQQFQISTRQEATSVLDTLNLTIQRYGTASVADYYDCLGVEGRFTDNNYGWRDLRLAKILPSGSMFTIEMPPVVVLR